MKDKESYFERAAEALREAILATDAGQQSFLLEKALRLHRLSIAQEHAELAKLGDSCSAPDPGGAPAKDR